VNILDENIPASQRQLLKSWRTRVYQIGYDVSRKGIKDDEIIPFLLTQRRPTFFTRDLGFYRRKLCHSNYCLVCLAVRREESAAFVRRLLRHSEFNTKAKRLGAVIRVSQAGLHLWRRHAEKEISLSWDS
jgi:hypothetical protein